MHKNPPQGWRAACVEVSDYVNKYCSLSQLVGLIAMDIIWLALEECMMSVFLKGSRCIEMYTCEGQFFSNLNAYLNVT